MSIPITQVEPGGSGELHSARNPRDLLWTRSPRLLGPRPQLEHEAASLNLDWLLGTLEHRLCEVDEHQVAPFNIGQPRAFVEHVQGKGRSSVPGAPAIEATMGRYSVLLLILDSKGICPTTDAVSFMMIVCLNIIVLLTGNDKLRQSLHGCNIIGTEPWNSTRRPAKCRVSDPNTAS